MKTRILFLLLISYSGAFAQVPNDKIEDRIRLEIGESHQSSTTDCTVDWECVDQSLTGKCIKYHNDQWFVFNSGQHSRLFLNLFDQACRDLRGVQIVVIKGDPCEIKSYEILNCVSLANQNDVFLRLDVEQHSDYLINVDGYLNDHCSFEIEIDTLSKGFPLNVVSEVKVRRKRKGKYIEMAWETPKELEEEVAGYEIWKRNPKGVRSQLLASFSAGRNSQGHSQEFFHYKDSMIEAGRSFYQVLALDGSGKSSLAAEFDYEIYASELDDRFNVRTAKIQIPLGEFERKGSKTILVFDYITGELLEKQEISKKSKRAFFNLGTYKYKQAGIKKVIVEIIEDQSKRKVRKVVELEM